MSEIVSSALHLVGRTPLPGARAGRDPDRAIKRGPRRVPAEVVTATQRDRLLDGVVHTVAAKGYDNARVTDICQAAGVTRPAFYAIFGGKDEAFRAAYRHGIGVVLELMEDAYQAADDWPSACRSALKVLLDVLSSVPAFAQLAIVEIDAAGDPARRERDELLRRFDQFFRDAPAAPAVGARTLLAGSVVGGIHAAIHRYVSADRVDELPTLLPTLTYFMLAPFVGRDTAAAAAGVRADDGTTTRAPCAPEKPA